MGEEEGPIVVGVLVWGFWLAEGNVNFDTRERLVVR